MREKIRPVEGELYASPDEVYFSTMVCIDLKQNIYSGFEAHLSAIGNERAKLRLFTTVKTISFDGKPKLKLETQHERKDALEYLKQGDMASQYLLSQIEEHLFAMGYSGKVILECIDGPIEFANVTGSPFENFIKTKKKTE